MQRIFKKGSLECDECNPSGFSRYYGCIKRHETFVKVISVLVKFTPPELLGCGGGDQQLAINKSKSHLPPLSQIRKSDIYFTSYFTTSLMNL